MMKPHATGCAITVTVVLLLSALGTPARADYQFMSSATGNFWYPSGQTSDSFRLNYTVYQRVSDTGNWHTDVGSVTARAGATTGTESYVYFYELYLNAPSAKFIPDFQMQGRFTSLGFIDSKVLSDSDGKILPFGGIAPPENPLDSGATGVSVVTASNPEPDNRYMVAGGNIGASLVAGGADFSFGDPGISGGQFTPVLFGTSDYSPWWVPGTITFAGGSVVTAPIPTPEPGTMILSAIGLSAFGGFGFWRRRRKAEPSAT